MSRKSKRHDDGRGPAVSFRVCNKGMRERKNEMSTYIGKMRTKLNAPRKTR